MNFETERSAESLPREGAVEETETRSRNYSAQGRIRGSPGGKSFGQRVPPLSRLLKDILERYPEGGQILKELVQNADDAGATEVQFLLDARPNAFGRKTLFNEEMEQFQGEALYAQNNAVFTSKDWEGIQRPYQSIKEEDPMKVGRFGIGFNSVYHLTDLPSIVSGKIIGFFDPHEKYVYEGQSGRKYCFSDARKYPDQFAPFNVLDCDLSASVYKGTLFRFPLRKQGQASDLSKSTHSPDTIRQLFDSFKADAHLVPLFLKSVASIKLLEWRPGKAAPEVVFSVGVDDRTQSEVLAARKRLEASFTKNETQVEEVFTAGITCQSGLQAAITQQWLVLHHISRSHVQVAELSDELKQLPWVGLALPLPPITEQASQLGRVFCFLPLPPSEDEDSNTGLPVHVHGSFSVADNRRSLKWPAADRRADKKATWNCLLLKHLIAPAYVSLILKGTSQLKPQDVYRAWPSPDAVRIHWMNHVIPGLLVGLVAARCFWTPSDGGKWITGSEAVVNQSSGLSSDKTAAFTEMVALRKPVVQLPSNVLSCLKLKSINFYYKQFNSAFVRTVLKGSLHYQTLDRSAKLDLLRFTLKDGLYADMISLCLLPLSDRSFTSFSHSSAYTSSIFIQSSECPLALFPGLEKKFLDTSLDSELCRALSSSQCCKVLQLEHLQVYRVPELLKQILPRGWVNGSRSPVSWSPRRLGQPTERWIQSVWKWLFAHPAYIRSLIGCHLLPCSNSTKMAQLVDLSNTIFARHDYSSARIVPDLALALENIGYIVLQDCPSYISSSTELTKLFWAPDKVLACVAKLPVAASSFKNWSNLQSRQMVQLLYQVISSNPPNAQQKTALYHLPLFRYYQSEDSVGLSTCNQFVPSSLKTGLPIQTHLLATPELQEQTILNHASTMYETLSFVQVFQKAVFPKFGTYGDKHKTEIAMYLLDNRYNLDASTRQQMASLEFVPVSTGILRKPAHLFEADSVLVGRLFRDKLVFPTGRFNPTQKYGRLLSSVVTFRSLTSITANEVTGIAKEASRGDLDKGEALLSLFVDYEWSRKFLRSEFRSLLLNLPWCPIEAAVPKYYPSCMLWKGSSSTSTPLSITCVHKNTGISSTDLPFLVGSRTCILKLKEGTTIDKTSQDLLGFKSPSVSDVFAHWKMAIRQYDLGECSQEFDKMMKCLFSALPCLISVWNASTLSQEITKSERERLIWLSPSLGFVRTDQVARSCSFPSSLEPWLFQVNSYSYHHLNSPAVLKALNRSLVNLTCSTFFLP
eukprot:m.305436 g.305436  ORF g.305436 m.305436 type:complete len:1260 (+) comp40861_c0_seq2:167-3946(+)